MYDSVEIKWAKMKVKFSSPRQNSEKLSWFFGSLRLGLYILIVIKVQIVGPNITPP
jgi:hypothetical protein